MPQNLSPAPNLLLAQLASVEDASSLRFASPQVPGVSPVVFLHCGSHSKTLIVDVVPPLLKSLITSRSPVLWTPSNWLPSFSSFPPWVILFWKNQKPC